MGRPQGCGGSGTAGLKAEVQCARGPACTALRGPCSNRCSSCHPSPLAMPQRERQEWEAARSELEAAKTAAEERATALLSGTEAMVASLEAAAEGRGQRNLATIVQQQLADWRQRVAGSSSKPDAVAGEGGAPPPASSGGSGGKIMI